MTRTSSNPKNVYLGIRIDPDTKAELKRLADLDRRDTSEYARIVLENHIDEKRKARK